MDFSSDELGSIAGALYDNACNANPLPKALACFLEELLDLVTEPVFLVGNDGKVLTINAAAKAFLRSQSNLSLQENRLAARTASENRVLGKMIRESTIRESAPPAVVIRNELGQPALRLTAVPLRSTEPVCWASGDGFFPLTAVLVAAPGTLPPARGETLADMFGLTPAEARVTAKLAGGASLKEIAAEFGLSHETVRTQIKSVFCKTDTHRQTDLVALIFSLGYTPGSR